MAYSLQASDLALMSNVSTMANGEVAPLLGRSFVGVVGKTLRWVMQFGHQGGTEVRQKVTTTQCCLMGR